MQAANHLLCFDLDGTLVDSAPDIAHALGAGLTAVDLPAPTLAQTRGWIGDGVDQLVRRALHDSNADDEATFTRALAAFHTSYPQNLFVRTELFDGVEQVLQTLLDDGFRLCCITNKRVDYAVALLEEAELSKYFEFTYGGDSFPKKKPHPEQIQAAAGRTQIALPQCIMIGDSDTDAGAAAAAGSGFIWTSFGYCKQLKTRRAGEFVQADSFLEIPQALESLLA